MATITCPSCDAQRVRGVAHRCAAPHLVNLPAATRWVIDTIVEAGGRPILVGGTVRDVFYGRHNKDTDIEVYGITDKEKLKDALSRIGQVDERGVSFGIVTLRIHDEEFDISFPRRESKNGTGHRGFITEIDADLDEVTAFGRRDFTLNALGWDPITEELVDPWGGLTDLYDRVLRHPTDSFSNDPLRVLRAVQFASRFKLTIAPETATLAASIADQFGTITPQRVWGELWKLAGLGQSISHGLAVLHETGWEKNFPELAAVRDVPQSPVWHPEGPVHLHLGLAADRAAHLAHQDLLDTDTRPLHVLAALLHDLGKAGAGTVVHDDGSITSRDHDELGVVAVGRFLERLRAPHDVAEFILPLVGNHMAHAARGSARPTGRQVRRLIRRLAEGGGNAPTLTDWARLYDADKNGRGLPPVENPGIEWLEVAEWLGGEAPADTIVRGHHLTGFGWKQCPGFAILIRASVEAQDDGLFHDEAGALLWLAEHGQAIIDANPPVVPETREERKARLRAAKLARRAAAAALV